MKMSNTIVNECLNECNERKSSDHLHKYSLLSKESIELMAEQNGYSDVSESALLLLSEDITYRLRQLVYNSQQFMRHSKRTRLTCEHVNRSLQWSDCDHIFGYASANNPIDNIYVKESNVYFCDDPIINLDIELNNILNQTVCDIKLYENSDNIGIDWVCGNQSSDIDINNHCNQQLINYYELITKAILGKDDHLSSIALKDLSNNSLLKPILPYIINFVSIGIKRLSHNINQLKTLLQTIEALFNNRSLYLATDAYMNVLIQSILFCIIEPLGASINPINDHWIIRDSASHLLSRIFDTEFDSPLCNRKLRSQTISTLKQTLLDFSKPFCSHYGVVVAFLSFGFDSIIEYLYPCLNQYWTHLLTSINNYQYLDSQIYSDAHRVYSSLLIVAQIILSKFNSNIFNEIKFYNFCELYNDLENIFGDSLTSMLYTNLENVRIHYFSQKANSLNDKDLFATPELLQTGEQLLDVFYESGQPLEEMNSNHSMCLDDDNSYDENSLISDTEKEAITADGNIQIKSTISDPSLGIKLTIKKLRKDQQIDLMEKEETKTSSVTNRTQYDTNEPIFDYYTIKANKHILFNIRGATNKMVQMSSKYQNNFGLISNLFNNDYNKIFISKAFSNKRSKKRIKDMLNSCNLFITL